MRRSSLTEGTKDEILAELDQLGRDATSEAKMRELAAAYGAVEEGAQEVRVRHSLYRVVEADDSPDAGEKVARAAG